MKREKKSMATSSTYDVFIDFRGMDTRYSFVSHLSAAFRRRRISVFLGEDCTKVAELERNVTNQSAIEGCKVFVVVFSENYAFSPLCLDTLVKFFELQRRKHKGLVVVPVYYGGVTRLMVEQQTEKFGDAFSEHKSSYSEDRVARWRNGLIEAAKLLGHESNAQRK